MVNGSQVQLRLTSDLHTHAHTNAFTLEHTGKHTHTHEQPEATKKNDNLGKGYDTKRRNFIKALGTFQDSFTSQAHLLLKCGHCAGKFLYQLDTSYGCLGRRDFNRENTSIGCQWASPWDIFLTDD